MFLIKLFLMSMAFGETRWVTLPLADSYEHEIIGGEGAYTVDEYRCIFFEENLLVHHMEVQHDILCFRDENALKYWIQLEMAPRLGKSNDEEFIQNYLLQVKRRGYLDVGDGAIRFPRKQLLVLLEAQSID